MRQLATLAVLVILGGTTAQAFTVSGNVSGREGFSLVFIYTIPTSLDTFYVTIANPFNGDYSQGGLPEGGYILFAFQDGNVNLLPDLDESRGFYGGDLPTVLDVTSDMGDIDIVLTPPNTGGFSGTVTYEGTETGATYVVASRTITFDGLPSGIGILLNNTGNGDYTAFVDSFGVYYAYAYMDLNTNLVYDEGEPYDVYGDDAEPEAISIVQGEAFPDEVDFELIALSAVPEAPAVAREFGLGLAYPNPFNAATTIPFTLERPLEIELVAYDVLGRTAQVLAHGSYAAGEHRVTFGGGELSSGLYVIEMRAQGTAVCAPVVLLK